MKFGVNFHKLDFLIAHDVFNLHGNLVVLLCDPRRNGIRRSLPVRSLAAFQMFIPHTNTWFSLWPVQASKNSDLISAHHSIYKHFLHTSLKCMCYIGIYIHAPTLTRHKTNTNRVVLFTFSSLDIFLLLEGSPLPLGWV